MTTRARPYLLRITVTALGFLVFDERCTTREHTSRHLVVAYQISAHKKPPGAPICQFLEFLALFVNAFWVSVDDNFGIRKGGKNVLFYRVGDDVRLIEA